MKNVALGQYFPADSILHKLDPRMKIILAVVYIVLTFVCKNVLSFALLILSAFLLIFMSKIPLKIIMRSLRPVIFILLFTTVINVFWMRGDTLIFEWKFIHIYLEGIYQAIFIVVRIFSLIVGTSVLLTYTTTPIQLADGIEQLLAPLKKIKIPVHDFAMLMTLALRFIPTLMEETDRIMMAQKSRGADFSSGGLIKRAKALIPILIPLFVSAFRRADELATAMECRCYHGGDGRTRMSVLRYSAKDFVFVSIMLILLGAVITLNIISVGYTM